MHKPESVQENETHKILGNFAIQTGHPIPTKRPGQVSIYKKKIKLSRGFCVQADHRLKMKVSVKINKYMNIIRELKMNVMKISVAVGALRTDSKSLELKS